MVAPQRAQEYWLKHVDQTAGRSEMEQNCRPMFAEAEFAAMIGDVIAKLGHGRALLDIGAGTGVLDLALAAHFDRIVAVEPTAVFETLMVNSTRMPSIEPVAAVGETIDLRGDTFDAALFYAVSYTRDDLVAEVMEHIAPNLEPKCRVLVGEVNDAEFREDYLRGLPDILRSKKLTETEIDAAMERNSMAAWHHFDDLAAPFIRLGFSCRRTASNPLHPLRHLKFDLVADRT
jgi:SAM-dependent methyltransferase